MKGLVQNKNLFITIFLVILITIGFYYYKTTKEIIMKGFIQNIENLTKENSNFRKVLYTSKYSQLVLMSLKPMEDIGMEVHEDTDQFFRIDAGKGKVVINGVETDIEDGFAVVIPSGSQHNIINTSETEDLKLYTIYSPAHHRDGVVHTTKQEAEADDESFNGETTE